MNKDYIVHWLLGVVCTAVWFWGDRAGVPAAAIQLAAATVPGLLGHAIAYQPTQTADAPAPAIPAAPTPATSENSQ